MRSRLPGHFYSALEIRAPLKGAALYGTVLELVEFYNLHFGMVSPPLNSPLLIFKHIRDLGLPGMSLSTGSAAIPDREQLRSTLLFAAWRLFLTWTSHFQYCTREPTAFPHIQKFSL